VVISGEARSTCRIMSWADTGAVHKQLTAQAAIPIRRPVIVLLQS
jgi:hypothetical protein